MATIEDVLINLRGLELTDAEVREALRRSRRRRRSRRAARASMVVAALVVIAVPAGGAEVADRMRSFLAGGEAPGRELRRDELPRWLVDHGTGHRVVVKAAGQRMVVYRAPSGAACFEFDGVGMCTPYDDLLDDSPIELFGPTGKPGGHFVLWGVATQSVRSVDVHFADGGAETVPVESAFGVPLDRKPRELVARDAHGRELAREDLAWRWEHRPAI